MGDLLREQVAQGTPAGAWWEWDYDGAAGGGGRGGVVVMLKQHVQTQQQVLITIKRPHVNPWSHTHALSILINTGQKAQSFMDQGVLVPDEVVVEMVKSR